MSLESVLIASRFLYVLSPMSFLVCPAPAQAAAPGLALEAQDKARQTRHDAKLFHTHTHTRTPINSYSPR